MVLQDRDLRACQLLLQLPSGATFLGSTPELLYERSGSCVASEAVAATRPRGPPGVVSYFFLNHLHQSNTLVIVFGVVLAHNLVFESAV